MAMLARDDLFGSDDVPLRSKDASARPLPGSEALLRFAVGGGRTVLAHQYVPYPLHVTRLFHLDPQRPDLATLYLQSASGGLYSGDRLRLAIEVAPNAAAHVTTQASTIVHDVRDRPAMQITRLTVASGGFCALTPEPLVLFPGADVVSEVDVQLADDACVILAEGFACHDPSCMNRPFKRVALATVVRDADGRVRISDRGAIAGTAFRGEASPAGPFAAAGTLFVLGRGSDRYHGAVLEDRLAAAGCLAGVTRAPHDLGYVTRILAPDGGALGRALGVAFTLAFETLVGSPPARRRK